jgi:hypothetical protein
MVSLMISYIILAGYEELLPMPHAKIERNTIVFWKFSLVFFVISLYWRVAFVRRMRTAMKKNIPIIA